jgi:hypothetical protein
VSIVVRTKRPLPSPIVEKAVEARSTYRRPRYAEAPDAGFGPCEAAETHVGRHREAPDAGEGRAQHMETHFHHGRSRS